MQKDALAERFEIFEAETPQELQRLLKERPAALCLTSASTLLHEDWSGANADGGPSRHEAISVLEHTAEGIGLVNARGELVWANKRLRHYSKEVLQHVAQFSLRALDDFNTPGEPHLPLESRRSREFAFASGDSFYELIVSPAEAALHDEDVVTSVVVVLWANTETRHLERQMHAVESAGAELLQFQPEVVRKLNAAERLKLLEDKIIHIAQSLLHFENFEVRLIDRKSNRLELVIAKNLSPLKIGVVIHAEPTGNGISGYVATTGESYVCNDPANDPLYREGLDDAESTLTVPLRLHDRVIGVFNVESRRPRDFNETDLALAELFGRYIAMSMNILDLLVVERTTTNQQLSENMLCELREPLSRLEHEAAALRELAGESSDLSQRAETILKLADGLKDRVRTCTSGPQTILETEQELHRAERDPELVGCRILVADDEPIIRDGLNLLLTQHGCDVTICANGVEAIDAVRKRAKNGESFEIVLSDIKMPDRNGYEIFRAARRVNRNVQVILMTGFGYDPHHSIVRATQEGLHSFLFKPFKASQLIEEVKKALAKVRDAENMPRSDEEE